MNIFRRFRKSISLRVVNWLGLSIMFACLLLSVGYIKRELSYDRYNVNANRIVRLSVESDQEQEDGQMYCTKFNDVLQQIPEIEKVVKLSGSSGYPAVLNYRGEKHVVNYYAAGPGFFDVFTIPWVHGDKNKDWLYENQMIVSESLARKILGDNGDIGEIDVREVYLSGGQVMDTTIYISGIFKDIPETSHFHTDMFIYRPNSFYVYLLLKEHTDILKLEQKITQLYEGKKEKTDKQKYRALLMPLTDIHLHSQYLNEPEQNGNINYIYFVVGANLLLLVVVLFNLWLNASLIFSSGRRYYQLLRLHGASSSTVIKDEAGLALLLGILSVIAGGLAAFYVLSAGHFLGRISFLETGISGLVFLSIVIAIPLLPVLKNISSTLFLDTSNDLRPVRFSYANVKYMVTAQYAVVMTVIILAFGIHKQMNMMKDRQVGGNKSNILVVAGEQPDPVKAKFALLKSELLKHTEIKEVTTSQLLPGVAMEQNVMAKRAEKDEEKEISMMVVGEDFLPFYNISTIAGRSFSPFKFDYTTEENMFFDWIFTKKRTNDFEEEYVINRKAMNLLGFNTPDEAVGQPLQIKAVGFDYINRGVIAGVTDNFNYTGFFETSEPMLIIQRQMLQNNIMVRLDPGRFRQAQDVFDKVWNEVHAGYPVKYDFMSNVFNKTYRYELYAEQLVN